MMLGKLCRSENSGVAELKEDGQVSCDTAQNLRLLCSYITPHARAASMFRSHRELLWPPLLA